MVAWKQPLSLTPDTKQTRSDIATLSKRNNRATEGEPSPEAGRAHAVVKANTLKRNAPLGMQFVFDVDARATTANVATQRQSHQSLPSTTLPLSWTPPF